MEEATSRHPSHEEGDHSHPCSAPSSSEETRHPKYLHPPKESAFVAHSSHLSQYNAEEEFDGPALSLSKFAPQRLRQEKSKWGCSSVGYPQRVLSNDLPGTPVINSGSPFSIHRFPNFDGHRNTELVLKHTPIRDEREPSDEPSSEVSIVKSDAEAGFLAAPSPRAFAPRTNLPHDHQPLDLPQENADEKQIHDVDEIEFVPIARETRTPADGHSRIKISESKGKTTKVTEFPSANHSIEKKKSLTSRPSSLGDPLKKFLDRQLRIESSSSDSDSSIAVRTSSRNSTLKQSTNSRRSKKSNRGKKKDSVQNYKREMKKQHQAFELKRLNNTRVWILWNLCIKIIQDLTVIYPSFQEQPRFPNQVFIFLQGICAYFILMGIIQSYWFKILKPVNWMLYVLVFNDQLGFYIAFGDHKDISHNIKGLLHELTLAFQIIWNLLMVVQQMEGRKAKIAMVLTNSAIMMVSISLTTFDLESIDKMDLFYIGLSCCTIIFLSTMFAFIEENVIKSNIDESLLDSSYKQYRQIFNRLQEGILVLRYDPKAKQRVERRSFLNFGLSVSEGSGKDEFKLYFVNQMCNRILSKVYDMKNFMNLHFRKQRLNQLGIAEVLHRKVFNEYKSKTSNFTPKAPNLAFKSGRSSCVLTAYSLEDILQMSPDEINQRVFTFRTSLKDGEEDNYTEIQDVIADCPNMVGISKEFLPNFLYFQIKRSVMLLPNGQTQFTLQLIDISSKIFFDDIKAQEQYTALINSTISHEMRNPLNSIINQCVIQKSHLKELQTAFSKISMDYFARKEFTSIVHEMHLSNEVSDSSSQLLLFHVQDILDMAQLKSGNFRKTVSRFNIKRAVEQIIQIQKYSADEKGINMSVEYENFPKLEAPRAASNNCQVGGLKSAQSEKEDFVVSSDKKRLQQVLLNLQSNALKFSRRGDHIRIKVFYIPKKQEGLQVIEEEGEVSRSPMRFQEQIPELSFSEDSFFFDDEQSESQSSDETSPKELSQHDRRSSFKISSQKMNNSSSRAGKRSSVASRQSLQLGKLSSAKDSHIISKKNQATKHEMFKQGSQEKIIVTVLDTGIGIKKHDQKKLFRMFGCLKNTRQMNTQGIGLGLFICKQITQEFGGSIFVESQYRRGTRFTFAFELDSLPPPPKPAQVSNTIEKFNMTSERMVPEPRVEVVPGDFSPSISERASSKAKFENQEHSSPGLMMNSSAAEKHIPRFNLFSFDKGLDGGIVSQSKILIADDEAFNIQAIRGILKVLGIRDIESRVVTCFNGEELVNLVKEAISQNDPFRYPLILTDCSMPILDGYEAAKEIRYQYKLIRSLQDRKQGCLSEVDQESIKDDMQRIKKRITSDSIKKELAASARKQVSGQMSHTLGNSKKIPANFPRIIAVTGHVEPQYIQKAFDKGIDRVFSKPLPVMDLAQELKALDLIPCIPEGVGREEDSEYSP